MKSYTLTADYSNEHPTLQGFIDGILQCSDETTWLVMADWLDEREIPNCIRQYRQSFNVAAEHKANHYHHDLPKTKKQAALLTILGCRFLQYNLFHQQTLAIAELLWTQVLSREQVKKTVQNIYPKIPKRFTKVHKGEARMRVSYAHLYFCTFMANKSSTMSHAIAATQNIIDASILAQGKRSDKEAQRKRWWMGSLPEALKRDQAYA